MLRPKPEFARFDIQIGASPPVFCREGGTIRPPASVPNRKTPGFVYDAKELGERTLALKRWILLTVVALLAAILAYALLPVLLVAAVSAAVATLVTFALTRYVDRRAQPAEPEKPDPRGELLGMLDGLVELNLSMREQGLAVGVMGRVEGIIDKLRALLGEINERYPGHELTWTLNQMARAYLPKVVNPYLALEPQAREAASAELLRSLDGVEAEVDNVAELVQGDKMGDFKAKAAFLRARFVPSR